MKAQDPVDLLLLFSPESTIHQGRDKHNNRNMNNETLVSREGRTV